MIHSKNNSINITSIQYSILGPDEIRRMGVIPSKLYIPTLLLQMVD